MGQSDDLVSLFVLAVVLLGFCGLAKILGSRGEMTFSVVIISHSDLSVCIYTCEIGMFTTGGKENAFIIRNINQQSLYSIPAYNQIYQRKPFQLSSI